MQVGAPQTGQAGPVPASPAVRTSSAGRRSPPPGAYATPSRLRTCIAPKAASRASEGQRTPRTAGSATVAPAAGAGCLPSKEAPAAACPQPTPPGPGLRARLTSPPPRSPASLAAAPRAAAISSLGVNRPATLSPSAIMQAPVRVAMSTIASAAGPGRVCARGERRAGISWGHTVGVPPGLLPGLQAAPANKGSARGHARHAVLCGQRSTTEAWRPAAATAAATPPPLALLALTHAALVLRKQHRVRQRQAALGIGVIHLNSLRSPGGGGEGTCSGRVQQPRK